MAKLKQEKLRKEQELKDQEKLQEQKLINYKEDILSENSKSFLYLLKSASGISGGGPSKGGFGPMGGIPMGGAPKGGNIFLFIFTSPLFQLQGSQAEPFHHRYGF